MRRNPFSGLILFLVLLIFLEILGYTGIFDERFFPSILQTLNHLTNTLLTDPDFRADLQISSFRLFAGVLLSVIISIPLVVVAGLNKSMRSAINVLNGLLYPLPKSAILPLLLLIFGLSGGAQIFLIFLGSVSLILITLLSGYIRLEASGYLTLARTLKLSRTKLIKKVLLPGLIPEFLQGLKLGSSYALVLMVVGEMIATQKGIGVYLWSSWEQFKILDMYSCLYLICFFGVFNFAIFEYLAEKYSDSQRGL